MSVNPIPTPTYWPVQFGQRDAKVIETATKATGAIQNKTIDSSNAVAGAAIAAGSITASQLASNAVETAKIKDANVTLGKLAAGIAPSHVVKFAGKHTVTAGEDTAESAAIAVPGVVATDIVLSFFESADATSVLQTAAPSVDTVTVSGTLKENDVVVYVVLRAAS